MQRRALEAEPLGQPRIAPPDDLVDKAAISVKRVEVRRNVKRLQAVSLSVAIPMLRGAYDENREQLRELWAALIAAATDPERTGRVRLSFIDVLKQFDPLDALVMRERYNLSGAASPTVV